MKEQRESKLLSILNANWQAETGAHYTYKVLSDKERNPQRRKCSARLGLCGKASRRLAGQKYFMHLVVGNQLIGAMLPERQTLWRTGSAELTLPSDAWRSTRAVTSPSMGKQLSCRATAALTPLAGF